MSNPPRFTDAFVTSGSPVPISNGVGNEWFPIFGVSWQVPHVPVREETPPAANPPAETSSLIPATPVILIGLELKIACPRATAARGSAGGKPVQASKGLKIAG